MNDHAKDNAIVIDGALYVCVAAFAFMSSQLGSDEAAKYISPIVLFWSKFFVGSLGAGALALKLFRSTAFADNKAAKAANGNGNGTQFITKSQVAELPPALSVAAPKPVPKDLPTGPEGGSVKP